METTLTLLAFREKMAKVLDEVENGNTVFLSKKGHLKAVLISPQDYLVHFAKKDPVLEKVQKGSVDLKLDRITLEEIDKEIKSVRQEIVGR